MDGPLPALRAVFVYLASPARRSPAVLRLRIVVQLAFASVCVLLGVRFAGFVNAAREGQLPLPERPPGVEGFLPISGLMGLVDWAYQGVLNTVHPAASVLFVIFVVIAFSARKAFCSWVCPIGLASECLARLGRRGLGRNLRPPRSVDIPLRSLKYLLLAFFCHAIFIEMDAADLRAFIESPYNQVSDVKMYLFFAEIGPLAGVVLSVLTLASIFVVGAWCRYLCPYGALLGLVSRLSPLRIRREPASCIDCAACDEACMARLPVSTRDSVSSVECTGCLDCIAVCPAPGTLSVGTRRRRLSPIAFAALVLGLFLAGYAGARLGGAWRNEIDDGRYVEHLERIDGDEYRHPGAATPAGTSRRSTGPDPQPSR